LKDITLKTVFLVTLASGGRRSEVHAFKKDILHTEHWRSITILPDPEFIAKTQLANKGPRVIRGVSIPALTKDLPSDMQEDRSLCPVRAVRFYLDQTRSIRDGTQKTVYCIQTWS
jgi:hypothetical protein